MHQCLYVEYNNSSVFVCVDCLYATDNLNHFWGGLFHNATTDGCLLVL